MQVQSVPARQSKPSLPYHPTYARRLYLTSSPQLWRSLIKYSLDVLQLPFTLAPPCSREACQAIQVETDQKLPGIGTLLASHPPAQS
jgi:hypothetical protein